MNSEDYIRNALRTESIPESIQINQHVLDYSLELATTLGSLLDQIKRKIYYKKDIDQTLFLQTVQFIQRTAETLNNYTRANNPNVMTVNGSILDVNQLNPRLLHAALGCSTESLELLETLHQQLTYGTPVDMVNFGEEIGDVEWYQAIGFNETGITEAHCREKNIAKLRQRYPQRFTNENAINRDLVKERAILEGKPVK